MDICDKAIHIVSNFLSASMKPDPITAARYMSEGVIIVFTGNRSMSSTMDITKFNSSRYRWVKKQLGTFDCMDKGDHVVVYSTGTLYGQWPDGTEFKNNRYVDRFEVKNNKIVRMDVWNDSAEWILMPDLNRKDSIK